MPSLTRFDIERWQILDNRIRVQVRDGYNVSHGKEEGKKKIKRKGSGRRKGEVLDLNLQSVGDPRQEPAVVNHAGKFDAMPPLLTDSGTSPGPAWATVQGVGGAHRHISAMSRL